MKLVIENINIPINKFIYSYLFDINIFRRCIYHYDMKYMYTSLRKIFIWNRFKPVLYVLEPALIMLNIMFCDYCWRNSIKHCL